MTCSECGGKAKFSKVDSVGWFKHKSGCSLALKAMCDAMIKTERYLEDAKSKTTKEAEGNNG